MANTLPPFPPGVQNPWSQSSWNVTQQSIYARANGEDAAESRANEAGTTLGASQAQSQQYRNNPKSLAAVLAQKASDKATAAAAAKKKPDPLAVLPPPVPGESRYRPVPGPRGKPGSDGIIGRDGAPGAPASEFLQIILDGLFASDEAHDIPGPPVSLKYPVTAGTLDRSIATAVVAGSNSAFNFYLVRDIDAFLFDGSTLICTVTFAAGSLVGSFVYVPNQTLNAAIQIGIVCDHVADPTLAGVNLVFCGELV